MTFGRLYLESVDSFYPVINIRTIKVGCNFYVFFRRAFVLINSNKVRFILFDDLKDRHSDLSFLYIQLVLDVIGLLFVSFLDKLVDKNYPFFIFSCGIIIQSSYLFTTLLKVRISCQLNVICIDLSFSFFFQDSQSTIFLKN